MFNFWSYLDASVPYQLGFQDAASPVMEGIINLHHDLMFFIVFIFWFVLVVLVRATYNFSGVRRADYVDPNSKIVVHGTAIEVIWTTLPALILIVVAIPSFALLYSIDEVVNPAITLKVVGHQWYWSYEFSDYVTPDQTEAVNFDSYMVSTDDLGRGTLRLLEVDNRVVLPVNTHVRILVTAADVLHSWAVPSLGIKMDACPGRLNQTSTYINREGVFFGQCSEICGPAHSGMPIAVEAVSLSKYVAWISEKL
uniref:Cytochrome c oxidase subunit 2 n=1 Tax=Haptophyceae sp. NIES-3900 TaxID=2748608 RepID=A0A7R6WDQ8_9EUKA|nr:cytochrome c oxidase subunit 2 [Haptophyceae sp. NIES-3900]